MGNSQLPTPPPRPWLWFLAGGAVGWMAVWQLCSDRAQGLLWQSAGLALAAALVAIPVGSALAWLLVRTDLPARQGLRCLLLASVAIPLYLHAAAWDAGFGQQGWWQLRTSSVGVAPLLTGFRGAAWVHGIAAIPWVTLIVGAELWLAPRDLEDAALLDGTQRQIAVEFSLRQISGAIVAALLWIVVTVSGEMTVTDLYQVRTYAEELYVGFALDPMEDTANFQPALVGVLPGVVLLGWLMLSALLIGWQIWPSQHASLDWSGPRRGQLGRWRWPSILFAYIVPLVLITVPLLNLLYQCGLTVQLDGDQRVRGWSLLKTVQLCCAAPGRYREELGWSLLLAQSSSLVAVVLSVLLAWWARRRRLARILAACLAAVLFALPAPLLALGVIQIFQATDNPWAARLYSQSITAPLIVLVAKCLPIVLLLIWNGFSRMNSDSIDSARLAGAGGWRQLVSIVVPQHGNLIACAWLVGVIIGLGDLAASILTVPPGVTTIAIRIFGLMHYGVEDQLAAICLFMMLLIVVAVFLAGGLWARARSCSVREQA